MLTLLKSLVQPKLDYCSQLWSPTDQSSINKLEDVQRHLVNFSADSGRRGRTIVPNTVVASAPAVVQHARERTLGVHGARTFNLLPENLRNMNTDHVDTFKNHLDVFLSSVPDQPTVTGLGRAATSNSLLHQLP